MKNFVVLIALALFLKPIFPVAAYLINYDYISKVLCVNVDQPAKECNGKCHLKKELANEVNDTKPTAPNKKSNTAEIEILICNQIMAFELPKIYPSASSKTNTQIVNHYHFSSQRRNFRPPTV